MPGGGVDHLSGRDSPFKGATGGMTYRSGANRSQLIAWSRAQTMARRDEVGERVPPCCRQVRAGARSSPSDLVAFFDRTLKLPVEPASASYGARRSASRTDPQPEPR